MRATTPDRSRKTHKRRSQKQRESLSLSWRTDIFGCRFANETAAECGDIYRAITVSPRLGRGQTLTGTT